MARKPTAPPSFDPGSTSAASVLPGVPLPAWADSAPVTATPDSEPELLAAPVPAAQLVTSGAPADAALPAPAPSAAPLTELAPPAPSAVPLAELAPPDATAAPTFDVPPPATAYPPGVVSPELMSTTAPLSLPHDGAPEPGAAVDPLADVLPATHHADVEDAPGRRLHPLVLGLAVLALIAVGAFAAFVTPGFLVSSDDGADQVVVPAKPAASAPAAAPSAAAPATPTAPTGTVVFRRTDGYQALTTGAATRLAATHEERLAALGASGGIAFAYTKAGAPNQVVAFAPRPTGGVVAAPAAFFAAWQKAYGVSGVHAVKTGAKATAAQCGTATYRGHHGTACAVAGPQAYGTVWMPGATPAQAAARIPAVVASVHVE